MNNPKVILFGTGYMGHEYAKVLINQKINFTVVGRSQQSARAFQKAIGINPFIGGASKFLSDCTDNSFKAIVAVDGEQLGNVTLALIKKGIKSILVEKPGGIDVKEIEQLKDSAKKHKAKLFIAYNRRFYSSVKKAQEIIKADGEVISFHFEFNEPGNKIDQLESSQKVKQLWLLHNSSHVIDLAFFLGGKPKYLSAYTSGSLTGIFGGAIFTGLGISKKGIPFTYHSNWLAPGRWGLEVMTQNHRLIFRPMEKLKAQKHGSFEILDIEIDDRLDTRFKPGLYREVESFLDNHNSLCTIEEQTEDLQWYNSILTGNVKPK